MPATHTAPQEDVAPPSSHSPLILHSSRTWNLVSSRQERRCNRNCKSGACYERQGVDQPQTYRVWVGRVRKGVFRLRPDRRGRRGGRLGWSWGHVQAKKIACAIDHGCAAGTGNSVGTCPINIYARHQRRWLYLQRPWAPYAQSWSPETDGPQDKATQQPPFPAYGPAQIKPKVKTPDGCKGKERCHKGATESREGGDRGEEGPGGRHWPPCRPAQGGGLGAENVFLGAQGSLPSGQDTPSLSQ